MPRVEQPAVRPRSSSPSTPTKLSRPQKRRRRLQLLAAAKDSITFKDVPSDLAEVSAKLDLILSWVVPGSASSEWPSCAPDTGNGGFAFRAEAPEFYPYLDELSHTGLASAESGKAGNMIADLPECTDEISDIAGHRWSNEERLHLDRGYHRDIQPLEGMIRDMRVCFMSWREYIASDDITDKSDPVEGLDCCMVCEVIIGNNQWTFAKDFDAQELSKTFGIDFESWKIRSSWLCESCSNAIDPQSSAKHSEENGSHNGAVDDDSEHSSVFLCLRCGNQTCKGGLWCRGGDPT